ncbi:MAG: hypothetical protein ACR2QE_15670 [Acidimicrobiales bacterium]
MTSIGVLMDGGRERASATLAAIEHAGPGTEVTLVATAEIASDELPDRFDGVVIGPGSPYQRMDLVLEAIRTARERGVPLVGT